MSIQFKPKSKATKSYEDVEYKYDLVAYWDKIGTLGDAEYSKKTYRDLDNELARQGEP